MKLTRQQKQGLTKTAKRFKLQFVILYGSQVKGRQKRDSDLDIAVFCSAKLKKPTKYVDLFEALSVIFPNYDLDLSFLNKSDALFLYEVTSNSQLLYGNSLSYTAFKAYAFRRYFDEVDLFKLQNILLKKQQALLQSEIL